MFNNTRTALGIMGSAYKWLAKAAVSPLVGLYELSKKAMCTPETDNDSMAFAAMLLGFWLSLPLQLPLWLIGGPIALGLTVITASFALVGAAVTTAVGFLACVGTFLSDLVSMCCSPRVSSAASVSDRAPLQGNNSAYLYSQTNPGIAPIPAQASNALLSGTATDTPSYGSYRSDVRDGSTPTPSF